MLIILFNINHLFADNEVLNSNTWKPFWLCANEWIVFYFNCTKGFQLVSTTQVNWMRKGIETENSRYFNLVKQYDVIIWANMTKTIRKKKKGKEKRCLTHISLGFYPSVWCRLVLDFLYIQLVYREIYGGVIFYVLEAPLLILKSSRYIRTIQTIS